MDTQKQYLRPEIYIHFYNVNKKFMEINEKMKYEMDSHKFK